jgi:hypothetical protein
MGDVTAPVVKPGSTCMCLRLGSFLICFLATLMTSRMLACRILPAPASDAGPDSSPVGRKASRGKSQRVGSTGVVMPLSWLDAAVKRPAVPATPPTTFAVDMHSDVDPDVQARAAAAAARAAQAQQALTVNDVFEMRSFVTPPPAVMLVSCALTLLLTGAVLVQASMYRVSMCTCISMTICAPLHHPVGKAMEWRDAKRAMGNADKLFAAITSLDKSSIPTKRLLSLIDLFQNPCLSQEVLRPVSGAVARIAEWVHSFVLYAGAMKDLALPSSETRRFAIFRLRFVCDACRLYDGCVMPTLVLLCDSFSLPPIPTVEDIVFGSTSKSQAAPKADVAPGSFADKLEQKRQMKLASSKSATGLSASTSVPRRSSTGGCAASIVSALCHVQSHLCCPRIMVKILACTTNPFPRMVPRLSMGILQAWCCRATNDSWAFPHRPCEECFEFSGCRHRQ